jgi:ABC-2 type transport system ATP-binding protein
MIELQHVTKMYGTVVGVNDLTFTIPAGAYGLMGPNGSGKTTLIQLLIGQLRPTLGRVRVFDSVPSKNRRILRRIGLCPASDLLFPNVSSREWVEYQVRLHGFSRQESKQRACNALDIVGMSAMMERPIGSYSLGMRQRTKIAQAIAHDPELLILDEPYNGLDPVGRHEMSTLLKRWASAGKGLLFASHVLQEIEMVTTSFLLIFGGRLLATGTPAEIESILADTPQEVQILGPDAVRLIARLAAAPWVESMSIGKQRSELRVSVREPFQLYQHMASWIAADQLHIERVGAADGNLTALFEALLRRHRGEMK